MEGYGYAWLKPDKPEKIFNAADIAFAFVMLVCGFLYWNLIRLYMLGAGVTIFVVIIFTISFVYLSKSQIKQKATSITFLIIAGLSAAQFVLFDNQMISMLNFMFISVVFVYWICISTDRRIDKKLSAYIVGDAVNQGLTMPFLNFGCCASGVKSSSKYKKVKGILPAILGILVFLPIIAVVVFLLVSADFAFEHFVNRILSVVSIARVATNVFQFLIGIPVAFYLYGLIYGNVKGRYADKITVESVDKVAKAVKFAPKTAIYSALTAFNAVYLLFFVVQVAYLFSAFNGNLPEAYTYAEYARRGFFELCAVAGINLGVLIVSGLTVKRGMDEEPKVLRVETIIISLFTILLIITALSKMVMYIGAYGLTPLRVFTSWFMVLLFFVFTVICIRQFKKFNSARIIIVGFIAMFLALSFGNVDGVIAKYNISRYEAGRLPTFDIDMVAGLSDAAVPYMYELYLKTDKSDIKMRQQLESAILNGAITGSEGFREFNFQRHRANEIRQQIANPYLK